MFKRLKTVVASILACSFLCGSMNIARAEENYKVTFDIKDINQNYNYGYAGIDMINAGNVNNKIGYFDLDLNPITDFKYDGVIHDYNKQGFASVYINNSSGGTTSYLLNKNGEEIESFNGELYYYNNIKTYYDTANEKLKYVKDDGTVLYDGEATSYTAFQNGEQAIFFTKNTKNAENNYAGSIGYSITKNGRIDEFHVGGGSWVAGFSNDYIFVNLAPRADNYIFSIEKNEIIGLLAYNDYENTEYVATRDLENGYRTACVNNHLSGKLQYNSNNALKALYKIDTSLYNEPYTKILKKLTETVYYSISVTNEKYILASRDSKYYYLTQDGVEVKSYDDATEFFNGLAIVINNGVGYVINDSFEQVSNTFKADTASFINEDRYIIKKDGIQYLLSLNRNAYIQNPTNPTNPETPTNPTDPTNPETPTIPEEPEKPTNPTNPIYPSYPPVWWWVNQNNQNSNTAKEEAVEEVVVSPIPADYDTIINSFTSQIDKAIKSGKTSISVKLKNISTISKDVIDKINEMAEKEGIKINLVVDTMDSDGKVETRLTLDPAKINGDLDLSAYTDNDRALKSKKNISSKYSNDFQILSMGQRGNGYGQVISVATKYDLSVNVKDLVLYTYNPKTGKLTRLKNPQCKLDKNGYLHFKSSYGNDIIISDGKLTKK